MKLLSFLYSNPSLYAKVMFRRNPYKANMRRSKDRNSVKWGGGYIQTYEVGNGLKKKSFLRPLTSLTDIIGRLYIKQHFLQIVPSLLYFPFIKVTNALLLVLQVFKRIPRKNLRKNKNPSNSEPRKSQELLVTGKEGDKYNSKKIKTIHQIEPAISLCFD